MQATRMRLFTGWLTAGLWMLVPLLSAWGEDDSTVGRTMKIHGWAMSGDCSLPCVADCSVDYIDASESAFARKQEGG